ncbi:nuclear transport factor 2 family protein [Aspergillus niger CBS 101883]|uniref:nuclear transport factor 2 family protein n=1 Tax=Aspergillus lacticoffeatus (strain CBS 101883) TaxID=1450533 RepID=UPI000D7F87E6|nr:uncharacterized protein BO96DRAFT_190989 [Aspergillus niger CBS 101883]PYH51458.1 hypothetical protein BO96DRAFT_190989 [Aspergillus niger CBS 101883]
MQRRKPRHRQLRDAPVRLPIAGNESASAVSIPSILSRTIRPDVGQSIWGGGGGGKAKKRVNRPMSSGNDVIHVGLGRDVTRPSPSNLLYSFLFPSILPFPLLALHRIASHPASRRFVLPAVRIPHRRNTPNRLPQEPQSQIQRNRTQLIPESPKMVGAIHERIREDLIGKERRLWTALTSADPGPEIKKMCNEEANLLFPQREILHLHSKPSISEALKPPFHHFDEYELQEVRVIVIDLMAGSVTYKINARRGEETYRGTGSTTWSQASDGEWRIVVHQETLM